MTGERRLRRHVGKIARWIGGSEHMVGTMSTLGTETLTTRLPMISGTYRLRAEGGTGYSLTSPGVMLRGNETITWNMRQNIVRLGSR